jgi:hypothetical protein
MMDKQDTKESKLGTGSSNTRENSPSQNKDTQNVLKKKKELIFKIDKFQNDSKNILNVFIKLPFEFRNVKPSSLTHPIFKHLENLKLTITNENYENIGMFQNFADIISQLTELRRLSLSFTK